MFENIQNIIPEAFLSFMALTLLMVGAFSKSQDKVKILNAITALTASIALCVIVYFSVTMKGARISSFLDSFILDDFSILMKSIILIILFSVCIIFFNDKFFPAKNSFELPILFLLAVIGAFLLISANDLMLMYLGLELMSLSSYVLVAINRDNQKASEAGVKYFVLGAVASCLILFGSSFIYGFLGTTNLIDLGIEFILVDKISELPIAVVIGIVFVISGFLFKVSAVPMHMWAPDVYEGSNKTVLAIISTIPKIAAISFIIRLAISIGEDLYKPFGLIFLFAAVLSMILGAFAALKQEDIRRLLSYSSIANMGFILAAISLGTEESYQAAILYLIVYSISVVGIISILTSLQKNNSDLVEISALAGLSKASPLSAIALSILMFSVAGIPPLAGFWAKFYVFISAITEGNYIIAGAGIISSIVACFYYLRIVKVVYFDDASTEVLEVKGSNSLQGVIITIITLIFVLSFYISEAKEILENHISSLY